MALLIAFVVVEERSREPMLPLRLLRQRRSPGPQIAVFAIASSFFAVFLYLTLYLQTVLGMSPIQTGLVYLPGTFLVFVVSGMTAQLGAKHSPAKIASVGLGARRRRARPDAASSASTPRGRRSCRASW